ncbi:hypothetical protein [Marinibacterium sp. SX1]|uniref:hypothetical protein n=1 Tax=Marinibacterium sp. SX1 TaxID=3388424 RepID=UPI003D181D3B
MAHLLYMIENNGAETMLDSIRYSESNGSRFSGLLTAEATDQSVWNTVLAQTPDYVVAPTLGSVIPHWHLVIPREPSINLHEHLFARRATDIRSIIAPVANAMPSSQVLWFEHGPRRPGSVVGCGTDYAHLHVILDAPFSFEAFRSAARAARVSWTRCDIEEAYGSIDGGDEYYAFGDVTSAYVSQGGEAPTSQLFRKIVAKLAGKAEEWDYRRFTHEACVRRTVEAWKAL